MFRYDKPDNMVDLFEESVRKYPNNTMYGTKNKEGKYEWVTFSDVAKRVDNLRSGLMAIGVQKGDGVGVISNNRAEFAVIAYAAYGCGARFIPMYEAELEKVWKYIVNDSGIKVLFVAKPAIFDKVKDFPKDVPSLEKIFVIDETGERSMAALEKLGESNPKASIKPQHSDIAALIYTSGTTGDPKGVLLSHGNFSTNVHAALKAFPQLCENDRSISILPWAHSFGMVADLYIFTRIGGSLGFMGSVTTLIDDLAQIRPTFLIAVPRIFNKVYASLIARMNEQGGLAKKLFFMGVNAANRRREFAEEGRKSLLADLINDIKFAIADKIVFQKIRDRFGGRLKGALTGSAATNVNIAHFFSDIGIPLYDAYGLTETTPAATANSPEHNRFGSVGRAIDQVKIVIDATVTEEGSSDGEIIVYGPNVMHGYHNKPDQTKEVMTADGGFRTGDRGMLDQDGFLFITGRIKEQFKLENGKYVFPAAIEEEIKLLPWVEHAMIHGANKSYNVCLIYPNMETLKKYGAKHNLTASPEELIGRKDIQDMVSKEITDALKQKFGAYEIPQKFLYLVEGFTVENGMLTQTMKLKRRMVVQKYQQELDSLYS